MEFREIYCNNCKKVIGKYNTKYYSIDKINELISSNHSSHIRDGHDVKLRIIKEKKA